MKLTGDQRTAIMAALELALDIAYHDGTRRDLAVAAEAWTLAGYHDGSIDQISHTSRDELARRVDQCRYGYPRRLLRADARGMLKSFTDLAISRVITWSNCSEAKRQRWLERGGHDR